MDSAWLKGGSHFATARMQCDWACGRCGAQFAIDNRVRWRSRSRSRSRGRDRGRPPVPPARIDAGPVLTTVVMVKRYGGHPEGAQLRVRRTWIHANGVLWVEVRVSSDAPLAVLEWLPRTTVVEGVVWRELK